MSPWRTWQPVDRGISSSLRSAPGRSVCTLRGAGDSSPGCFGSSPMRCTPDSEPPATRFAVEGGGRDHAPSRLKRSVWTDRIRNGSCASLCLVAVRHCVVDGGEEESGLTWVREVEERGVAVAERVLDRSVVESLLTLLESAGTPVSRSRLLRNPVSRKGPTCHCAFPPPSDCCAGISMCDALTRTISKRGAFAVAAADRCRDAACHGDERLLDSQCHGRIDPRGTLSRDPAGRERGGQECRRGNGESQRVTGSHAEQQ